MHHAAAVGKAGRWRLQDDGTSYSESPVTLATLSLSIDERIPNVDGDAFHSFPPDGSVRCLGSAGRGTKDEVLLWDEKV